MAIARIKLTSIEATNIIGRPEIINAVRICTIRQASLIVWPDCDATCCQARLLELLKTILTSPTEMAWFDRLIYYVVVNNPQINWEGYFTDVPGIEAEIDIACFSAIYGIVGCTKPARLSVISNPAQLSESNLNSAQLAITIHNDYFVNSSLSASNFTLQNAPSGLTVGDVAFVSEDQALVTLVYNGADFTGDIEEMTLTILAAEVVGNANIVSQPIFIAGLEESMIATPDRTMTESNLNGTIITLDLTNETFVNPINAGMFSLNNAPTGTTVGDVARVSATRATVNILFNGTDFDANVNNFRVTAGGTSLSRGNALQSQNMTITAVVE